MEANLTLEVAVLMIECTTCHEKVFTADGRQPDRALNCGCCREDHDHGRSANDTGVACRPILITVLPGSASLSVM